MLSIKQCLEIMHSGQTFSCTVVTFDKRRKDKCGKLRFYPQAKLVWGDEQQKAPKVKGEREPTAKERAYMLPEMEQDRRNPNHKWHYTRNIRLYMDGRPTETIEKIHPPLIIEFNGQQTTP